MGAPSAPSPLGRLTVMVANAVAIDFVQLQVIVVEVGRAFSADVGSG